LMSAPALRFTLARINFSASFSITCKEQMHGHITVWHLGCVLHNCKTVLSPQTQSCSERPTRTRHSPTAAAVNCAYA
jgi:hypothetical protein